MINAKCFMVHNFFKVGGKGVRFLRRNVIKIELKTNLTR